MSGPLAIDSIEFARRHKRLEGDVAVSDMSRLQSLVLSGEGALHYSVSGLVSDLGKHRLCLEVVGWLSLECQRCLGKLEFPVEISVLLELVEGSDSFVPIEEEEDAVDMIPAESAMDVLALVEDEVLLSLPLAPMHPPGVCRDAVAQIIPELEKPNPFEVLAGLKKNI